MDKHNLNAEKLETAMDGMRRAMMAARERLGEGLQLTRTQIEILMLLSDRSLPTGEIARKLFLSQSAVTQTIDTLVRRELVERHPDEQDGRMIRLELSRGGRQLTSHVRGLRREFIQSLTEQLSSKELEVMITVTSKLTALLEEKKSPINK
jgi:DNA-binding MarR family transcriptional regulator